MTPPQAAGWLLSTDASDVADTAVAFGGAVDLTPLD
jgi:hypothetical protein